MTSPAIRNGERPEITLALLERFKAYHAKNAAWGSLHCVLDDRNLKGDPAFEIDHAKTIGDAEGLALALILSTMTPSQREKISRRC